MKTSIEIGVHEQDKPLRARLVQPLSARLAGAGWVTVHVGDFPAEVVLYFRSPESAVDFANDLRDKVLTACTVKPAADPLIVTAPLVPADPTVPANC